MPRRLALEQTIGTSRGRHAGIIERLGRELRSKCYNRSCQGFFSQSNLLQSRGLFASGQSLKFIFGYGFSTVLRMRFLFEMSLRPFSGLM
jgi:hypothetical protein